MDFLTDHADEYKRISDEHDPIYKDMISAIELVKKFIIANNLIIYGGTAIDFALRLRGDKIYHDSVLQVPDLDFYSFNSVEHSYELADILFKAGYTEVRAITATHTTTQKVDLVDNHYIADLSYVPKKIFDQLPYIIYNGMRVISPNYQRIDIHIALSFPYASSPLEAFFDRWNKDIKRFNLLDQYYPITNPKKEIALKLVSCSLRKYVLSGFAAYAALYSYVSNHYDCGDAIEVKFSAAKESLIYEAMPNNYLTAAIMHFDIEKAASELSLTGVKYYYPNFNLLFERLEGRMADQPITIFSTKNKLLSVNSLKIGEETLRIVNVQFLLQQFLAAYFLSSDATYLAFYQSILIMIAKSANMPSDDAVNPLLPTINTYGNNNISTANEVMLNKLHVDLDKVIPIVIPSNYYSNKNKPHPNFNMAECKFFQIDGSEIIPVDE